MTGWHWKYSCRLNRLLFGQRGEPLCSRAYRRNWRAFMYCADIAFAEYQHCKHIHARWSGRDSL